MVGILLSYWGGLFSGALLVSGRVHSGKSTAGTYKKEVDGRWCFFFNWVIFKFHVNFQAVSSVSWEFIPSKSQIKGLHWHELKNCIPWCIIRIPEEFEDLDYPGLEKKHMIPTISYNIYVQHQPKRGKKKSNLVFLQVTPKEAMESSPRSMEGLGAKGHQKANGFLKAWNIRSNPSKVFSGPMVHDVPCDKVDHITHHIMGPPLNFVNKRQVAKAKSNIFEVFIAKTLRFSGRT